jgi:hypothetical protein
MNIKQLSPGAYMAAGIMTGVVLGGGVAFLTHKPAGIIVVGYPLGLAFGLILKNKFTSKYPNDSRMTPREKRNQMIMILLICTIVMIGMFSFLILSR